MNLEQLKQAGFDDNEIGAYVASKRPGLLSAGFSEDEINSHFGITDVAIPDDMAVSHGASEPELLPSHAQEVGNVIPSLEKPHIAGTPEEVMGGRGLPREPGIYEAPPPADKFTKTIAEAVIPGAKIISGEQELLSPETMMEVPTMIGMGALLGEVGKGVLGAIKGATWFRMLTNPERGVVTKTLDDMIKSGMSEADILRKWRNPTWRADALARRMKPEGTIPEGAPSGPTVTPVAPQQPAGHLPPGQGFTLKEKPVQTQVKKAPEPQIYVKSEAGYQPGFWNEDLQDWVTPLKPSGVPQLPPGQGFAGPKEPPPATMVKKGPVEQPKGVGVEISATGEPVYPKGAKPPVQTLPEGVEAPQSPVSPEVAKVKGEVATPAEKAEIVPVQPQSKGKIEEIAADTLKKAQQAAKYLRIPDGQWKWVKRPKGADIPGPHKTIQTPPITSVEKVEARPGGEEEVKGKEAWEMMQAEWNDLNIISKRLLGSEYVKVIEPTVKEKKYATRTDVIDSGRAGVSRVDLERPNFHKDIVQQALSSGKPVPQNVLDEYPDLKKPAPEKEVEPATYTEELKKRADEQYAGWKGREKPAGGVSALPPGMPQAPELSATAKDQYALLPQGLQFPSKGKQVTPTLEGSPLLQASERAKQEKVQPGLFNPATPAEVVEKTVYSNLPKKKAPTDLLGWIRSKGGIKAGTVSADIQSLSQKESGFRGKASLVRKDGIALDILRDHAEWEGLIPPGTSTDDFGEAIKDQVEGYVKGVEKVPGIGATDAEVEKYIQKQEAKKDAEYAAVYDKDPRLTDPETFKTLTADLDSEIMAIGERDGYSQDEISEIERQAIQAVEGEAFLTDSQIEKELSDFFSAPKAEPAKEPAKVVSAEKVGGSGVEYGSEAKEKSKKVSSPEGEVDYSSSGIQKDFPEIVSRRTGSYLSGVTHVKSAEDAAHVGAVNLSDNPQEHFISIATDKDGKIISAYRHTIGTSGESLVDSKVVVGQALNTPSATDIWLVHNHPSRIAKLSPEDKNLHEEIKNLARGSGVSIRETIAVGGESYSTTSVDEIPLPKANLLHEIEMVERKFVKFGSGTSIKNRHDLEAFVNEHLPYGGLILTNRNHVPISLLPIKNFTSLRGDPQKAILKAADRQNAVSFFVVDKSKDIQVEDVNNLMKFAKASHMDLTDVFDKFGSLVWRTQSRDWDSMKKDAKVDFQAFIPPIATAGAYMASKKKDDSKNKKPITTKVINGKTYVKVNEGWYERP